MKFSKSIFYLLSVFFVISTKAQINVSDSTKFEKQFVITKNDGSEYIGEILNDDGREVLIQTSLLGKIYIPKSDIKSIVIVKNEKDIIFGEYNASGPFTTRYAFTTNSLPIVKGENYSMANLYGPEVHFAISNNLNIGVMSTWIASPLVLAVKYSFKNKESKINFSAGTLIGTTGYLNSFKGYGGLHWLGMTLGDRKNNISFSGGYAYFQSGNTIDINEPGIYYNKQPNYTSKQKPLTNGPIFSVAGICKVGAKVSFIFDSMLGLFNQESIETEYREITPSAFNGSIYINQTFEYKVTKSNYLATALFIMPGMRFQSNDKKAFQVCLAGVSVFGKSNTSFPFPMCSWFRKF